MEQLHLWERVRLRSARLLRTITATLAAIVARLRLELPAPGDATNGLIGSSDGAHDGGHDGGHRSPPDGELTAAMAAIVAEGGPPAAWLDIAGSKGPPAHWLEYIRQRLAVSDNGPAVVSQQIGVSDHPPVMADSAPRPLPSATKNSSLPPQYAMRIHPPAPPAETPGSPKIVAQDAVLPGVRALAASAAPPARKTAPPGGAAMAASVAAGPEAPARPLLRIQERAPGPALPAQKTALPGGAALAASVAAGPEAPARPPLSDQERAPSRYPGPALPDRRPPASASGATLAASVAAGPEASSGPAAQKASLQHAPAEARPFAEGADWSNAQAPARAAETVEPDSPPPGQVRPVGEHADIDRPSMAIDLPEGESPALPGSPRWRPSPAAPLGDGGHRAQVQIKKDGKSQPTALSQPPSPNGDFSAAARPQPSISANLPQYFGNHPPAAPGNLNPAMRLSPSAFGDLPPTFSDQQSNAGDLSSTTRSTLSTQAELEVFERTRQRIRRLEREQQGQVWSEFTF